MSGRNALRIAMIAPFAVHGPLGTTRWRVLPLARALAAGGDTVRVIVPPYDWPPDSGRCWQDRGVEVVNVPLARGGSEVGGLALAARVVREVAAFAPDVVHCFKPKGPGGLAGRWLARLGYPVVQDSDDWETGWNQRAGYPLRWRWLFTWQERSGLRGAAAVTVASRWMEGLAHRLRGADEAVFYLPNGVETYGSCSDYAMHPMLAMAHQPTGRALLYTRFVEIGPADVWRVWSAVRCRMGEAARLVVAGEGLAGEEVELQRLAGETTSLVRVGWLDPRTLPGVLAGVDAAMFPVSDTPLNRAKSPMRLLDALAAGVPVAAQAVGEYGQYVIDGETGLLAPPGEPDALADAVVRLLADRPLAQRLGAAAANRTAREHSWVRLAGTARLAYRSALDRRPRSGEPV